MQGEVVKCKACGKEFMDERSIIMHKIKAHGDVNAVNYLSGQEKEEILRKVTVRNLYLSELPPDMIALQVDLDVPTVIKIIDEIKKEWLV